MPRISFENFGNFGLVSLIRYADNQILIQNLLLALKFKSHLNIFTKNWYQRYFENFPRQKEISSSSVYY